MEKRAKISLLLLIVYLTIVLHDGVSHLHALVPVFESGHHASHDDLEEPHLHAFQLGIIHLLGHLLEEAHDAAEHGDLYWVQAQDSSAAKTALLKVKIAASPLFYPTLPIAANLTALPYWPFTSGLSPRLSRSNTLLRAPPGAV